MSSITSVFTFLPSTLTNELLSSFNEIQKNFRERRWEPAELNGGKLCEVVYTILRGHIDSSMPAKSEKPRNMVDSCHALEQSPTSFPRSIRIQIPRMIIALYEIRNNRNVGHTGGDVNPNEMDAVTVLYISKWIMAELVRVFHNISIKDAESVVNSLVEKNVPILWEVDGKYRVLDSELKTKDQTLLILYAKNEMVNELDLVEWIEHSNPSIYRRDILRKLHKTRLIEYNESSKSAKISPKGILFVEKELLNTVNR